jgi:hypothetical protein
MSAVECLALVASVLFDARFLELKRENDAVAAGCAVWRELHVCMDGVWQRTPGKMDGLERLALTCRRFCDAQIIELRRENERLKLALFWKMYSADQLRQCVRGFLWTSSLFQCWCPSCSANGRFYLDEDEAPPSHTRRCKPCQYKPWFVDFIQDMDMRVAYGVDYGLDFEHFRLFGTEDWFWGYGARLLNARSVHDPDLRKLEYMFDNLFYMTNLAQHDY